MIAFSRIFGNESWFINQVGQTLFWSILQPDSKKLQNRFGGSSFLWVMANLCFLQNVYVLQITGLFPFSGKFRIKCTNPLKRACRKLQSLLSLCFLKIQLLVEGHFSTFELISYSFLQRNCCYIGASQNIFTWKVQRVKSIADLTDKTNIFQTTVPSFRTSFWKRLYAYFHVTVKKYISTDIRTLFFICLGLS